MKAEEIANCLIESFSGLSVKEQMNRTLNPRSVERYIVEKFGNEKYSELTTASSSDWRNAWLLFEQHNGIHTHGDYQEAIK